MSYQIFWSEDILPALTDAQKEEYSSIGMQQVYPIGNEVDGMRLFHGIGSKETIDSMLEFISFKNPLVISVKDRTGLEYGYKIEDGETVPDTDLTPYPVEDKTDFFADTEGVDEDGNAISISTPRHKFAGWG